MASSFSHAVAGLSIGMCFYDSRIPKRVWAIGTLCAVIPDFDAIGFQFGIKYDDLWGHRGFTHSLIFAALLAVAFVVLVFPRALLTLDRFSIWAYFFLATASHGFLDAMTEGGLGVAFFSPFNNRRYIFPWTPIRVSPMGVGRFTTRGLPFLRSEFLWIWLPAILLVASVWILRREVFAPTDAEFSE